MMFHQEAQDVAVADGAVQVLLSQEKLTLFDCFLGVLRVNSRKEEKEESIQLRV